ncbi:MAG: hypothetical protein AB1716_12335 [Planctomycetota bacterium]
MVRAIKEIVVIGPGGLIQIRRPDLPVGTEVEVIVMVDEELEAGAPPPLTSLFGAAKGIFASGEEADAFLRAERDAWER